MSIVFDSSTLQQRALTLYRQAFTERVAPHMQQIEALVRRADEDGYRSDDVPPGGHMHNTQKYFAPERPICVTEPLVETLPSALFQDSISCSTTMSKCCLVSVARE